MEGAGFEFGKDILGKNEQKAQRKNSKSKDNRPHNGRERFSVLDHLRNNLHMSDGRASVLTPIIEKAVTTTHPMNSHRLNFFLSTINASTAVIGVVS
jgi:hypothetical protein